MDYKKEIRSIIDEKGKKSCSKIIKSNEILWNEILDKTRNIHTNNSMLRINAYLSDKKSLTCKNNNILKYRDGNFVFCGRASSCACAKESVSNSVKKTKKARSKEDIDRENKKRENTILLKSNGEYSNNGQSKIAKEKHKEFYKDKDSVKKITDNHKNKCLEKYGVTNYSKTDDYKNKTKETNLKKYGVINPMMNPVISQKSKENRSNPIINFEGNFKKIKDRLIKSGIDILTPFSEYYGVADRPTWKFKCLTCDYSFEKRFDYASLPICRNCNPLPILYKSNEELDLLSFIQQNYTGTIISGDKKTLNGRELDIFLPDINLAIEYCGLYWHSEISSGKKYKYHYSKYFDCKQKNIQLITIFSDEWIDKNDIVKQCLLSKINQQTKIFARKCTVQEISKTDAQIFLNEVHLQGAPNNISKTIGLFYDNKLVAAMTFLNKNKNKVELVRFASKNNVVGGASKLLKYFIKTNPEVESIISFSDNRWSNGNLYYTLGFEVDGYVPPMQSYVEKYKKRYHKRIFNKNYLNKLINQDFGTEWEKMQKLGYDRIWDCGKIRFILRIMH